MSILFDGTNDYAENTNAPPVLTPPFTFMSWAKRAATGNAHSLIAIGQPGSADHYHRSYISSSGTLFTTTRDTTTSNGQSTADVTDTTTWHLCGGVWAAVNSRTSWLDAVGGTPNTGNRTGVTSPAMTRVASLTDGTHDMNGRIAHMAMWNTSLLQADWDALLAGANPLTIQNANLVWYVPGIVDANDVVGTYHLTLVNEAQIDADNPTVDAAPSSSVPNLFVVSSGMRWT